MKSHSPTVASIIYNVTLKVDAQIADAWFEWMMREFIPKVLNTGCFFDYTILKLLDIDDAEGPTYAVQYHAESKADYNRFIELYSATIQKQTFEKWREQIFSFGSVMEVVK
jgi:hypothetical protein